MQNQALRIILKTPKYVATPDLHDISGLTPIKQHLIEFGSKRLKSLVKSSPIMGETIAQWNQVKHIEENASPLDVLNI